MTQYDDERAYYVSRLGWASDDLTYSLPDLVEAITSKVNIKDINPSISNTFDRLGLLTSRRSMAPVTTKMITTFAPGHGFVPQGTGPAYFGDDTSTFALGSQSLKITSLSNATQASTQNNALPAFSLTGQQLRVWFRIADITNLSSIMVYAADSAAYTNFYHWQLLVGPAAISQVYPRSGEWVSITLNVADASVVGAPNRGALVTLRLAAQFTNGFSSDIHWGGVATTPDTSWSGGVISISFDDGGVEQFTNARPIMDKYGYSGTTYIIKDIIDTAGCMSTSQLQALEKNHGWMVGFHSYYLASHAAGLPNLSTNALNRECILFREWCDENRFKGKDHMAWPLGEFSPAAIDIVSKYFVSARSIISGVSGMGTQSENTRPASPYRLRSMSVVDANFASVAASITACAANKTWLHLTFHDVNDIPTANTITIANFTSAMAAIYAANIPVRTVDEVLALG